MVLQNIKHSNSQYNDYVYAFIMLIFNVKWLNVPASAVIKYNVISTVH